MKNYAILSILILAVLPGCWPKKKAKPVYPETTPAAQLTPETEASYNFTRDADAFEIEDELAGDAFAANEAAAPTRIVNPKEDFDWDEIAYDNQSADPIQFDFDDTKIRPSEVSKLDRNAKILRDELEADDSLRVVAKGHACKITKSELYNRNISQERADHVAKEYIKRGVAPARISTIGFGASQLLTNEDGMEAQSINRRVETELVLDGAAAQAQPSVNEG